MHLANVSFHLAGTGFSLAPIFDMCSMGFSPRSTGEIPPYTFSPAGIDGSLGFVNDTIPMVKAMAREFWFRLAKNELISENLRYFLEKNSIIEQLEV
jgi:hypothetical protein